MLKAIKSSLLPIVLRGGFNPLVVGLVSIGLVIGLFTISTFLNDSPLNNSLYYWRGYPWLPAIIFSIFLISFSVVVRSSFPLQEWANDQAVPPPIRFLLKILTVVDPELFSTLGWWLLIIGASISLLMLWLFPKCISSDDILVSFRIWKGDTLIATPSLGEMVMIDSEVTVLMQADIAPLSSEKKIPNFECLWTDGGIASDGKFIHTRGCKVDYKNGQDDIIDPVSMQLNQWHCPSLDSYPFFIGLKR